MVGMSKEIYGLPKSNKMSTLYSSIHFLKLAIKLLVYGYHSQSSALCGLEVMCCQFLKHLILQHFCLPALQPTVRPSNCRHVGPVFLTIQVITV